MLSTLITAMNASVKEIKFKILLFNFSVSTNGTEDPKTKTAWL